MDYYLEVLKEEYVEFDGRVRRKKYWMFNLVNFIISSVLRSISSAFFGLYGLAVFFPSLGVTVRRLHDTDRSGWWCLISLVPFIGSIILLVFLVQDSTPGENEYGLNPKEESS